MSPLGRAFARHAGVVAIVWQPEVRLDIGEQMVEQVPLDAHQQNQAQKIR